MSFVLTEGTDNDEFAYVAFAYACVASENQLKWPPNSSLQTDKNSRTKPNLKKEPTWTVT